MTLLPNTGRKRAQRLLPALGVCAECEAAPAVERHHWDRDPANNTHNVVPLCARCHARMHPERQAAAVAAMSAAVRARTHCPQGHPYDEANTYLDRHGYRHCRACNRERHRR